jgi:hypothetical protein
MGTQKQNAMAKLLHSKPTHSFTNSLSSSILYLFIYFWQTEATFEPKKV